MKTTKKLLPGQPGTKKWIAQYGDALVCVRYRHDEQKHTQITTVELIVQSKPLKQHKGTIPANKIIFLRISYYEVYLRKVVKEAGGRWNRQKKVWELPFEQVRQLGLEERIVLENG